VISIPASAVCLKIKSGFVNKFAGYMKGEIMSKRSHAYIVMAVAVFMAISLSLFPVSRAAA
jgi:hypothetical protein